MVGVTGGEGNDSGDVFFRGRCEGQGASEHRELDSRRVQGVVVNPGYCKDRQTALDSGVINAFPFRAGHGVWGRQRGDTRQGEGERCPDACAEAVKSTLTRTARRRLFH